MLNMNAALSVYPDGSIEIESYDNDWGPWPITLEEMSDAGFEITKKNADKFFRIVDGQQYVKIRYVRIAVMQKEDGSPQFISITES